MASSSLSIGFMSVQFRYTWAKGTFPFIISPVLRRINLNLNMYIINKVFMLSLQKDATA